MPYNNMPKEKWPSMERCVADVKAKGNTKNPYAVCFASVTGTIKKNLTNRKFKKK